MSTIILSKETDPDWIILKSATWLTNSKGKPILEIEIYNPLDRTYDGEGTYLKFSGQSNEQCMVEKGSRATYPKPIPVDIEINESGLNVSSGDPLYEELLQRKAEYHQQNCFQNPHVVVSLGKFAVPAKSMIRIRYALNISHQLLPNKFGSRSMGEKGAVPFGFEKWSKSFTVTDDLISPKTINVKIP